MYIYLTLTLLLIKFFFLIKRISKNRTEVISFVKVI